MPYVQNNSQTVTALLAADVANSGTVTLSYPAGTSQLDFNAGLAGPNPVVWVGGDKMAAGTFSLSYGASNITLTNSTGATWTAGSALTVGLDQVDGNSVVPFVFPVDLASITTTQDVITEIRLGLDGTIEYFAFVSNVPVTTGSKLASFNMEIGTTNVTGGVIALTSANATPMGAVIESTAITGNNTLTRTSKFSIEAASVTAFSEGRGYFFVRVRRNAATT